MLHEAAGRGVPNDAVSTPGATDHPVASSSDDPSETGERFASSSGWRAASPTSTSPRCDGWRVEGAVRLGVLVMYRGVVELDVSFVRTFVGERNHKQARCATTIVAYTYIIIIETRPLRVQTTAQAKFHFLHLQLKI